MHARKCIAVVEEGIGAIVAPCLRAARKHPRFGSSPRTIRILKLFHVISLSDPSRSGEGLNGKACGFR